MPNCRLRTTKFSPLLSPLLPLSFPSCSLFGLPAMRQIFAWGIKLSWGHLSVASQLSYQRLVIFVCDTLMLQLNLQQSLVNNFPPLLKTVAIHNQLVGVAGKTTLWRIVAAIRVSPRGYNLPNQVGWPRHLLD